jgi:intein/homing endonuclease
MGDLINIKVLIEGEAREILEEFIEQNKDEMYAKEIEFVGSKGEFEKEFEVVETRIRISGSLVK